MKSRLLQLRGIPKAVFAMCATAKYLQAILCSSAPAAELISPGGSPLEIVQSLKKIASLDGNLIVYPGHDRQSTLDFERANNPFLNRA